MNIYPSTKVRPYVYIGIHKETGQIYVGYREKNVRLNKPSHIDLFEYRTSSAIVQPIFDQFDWLIAAEFEIGDDAYDFEQFSIYENWDNPLLLNESCFYDKKRFKCKKGNIHSKGNGGANKGIIRLDLTERNKGNSYGKANKGRILGPQSEETKNNKRKSMLGKNTRPSPQRGSTKKKREIVICPYCLKEGGEGNMKRYHFDNCNTKEKT